MIQDCKKQSKLQNWVKMQNFRKIEIWSIFLAGLPIIGFIYNSCFFLSIPPLDTIFEFALLVLGLFGFPIFGSSDK